MKIKFLNLGRIKETELDLKPLTVIVGPNNSNKTYVAYSVYGLMARRGSISHYDERLRFSRKSDSSLSIGVQTTLTNHLLRGARSRASNFKRSLTSFFQDSSGRLFEKTSFQVDISSDEIEEILRKNEKLQLRSFDRTFGLSLENHRLQIRRERSAGGNKSRVSQHDIGTALINLLTTVLYPSPFVLPAERNAFVLTYQLLENRRYTLLREMQRSFFTRRSIKSRQLELFREQGDIGFPEPLEDFLALLSQIHLGSKTREGMKGGRVFQKLADQVEHHIQDDNRVFFHPTKLGRELKVHIDNGLTIDLFNASSSIKQLTPVLLYLRFLAAENQMLIIDEPEMNLHPESQAKFLEILAILVNLGVKVLLTTHSPYFMAHLNNLVNGRQGSPIVLKRQSTFLYLRDPRAFLSLDDVSAYEMSDYELKTLKDPDYGIRWDTLSDISADLQQKYFQIYDAGGVSGEKKKRRPSRASAQ